MVLDLFFAWLFAGLPYPWSWFTASVVNYVTPIGLVLGGFAVFAWYFTRRRRAT